MKDPCALDYKPYNSSTGILVRPIIDSLRVSDYNSASLLRGVGFYARFLYR
ncbi:protein of unknown function [Vibrio tapetis subsp. tapetis]|uniref:Uncharacterized protein n=1 Tax=Vibrio tapetis subsp. tapetis TaxID=1671868 RepID=A0A2N8ZH43_9VIBR|nr:protein of unknown function [Vibrio tapetis subsp. tapetis]